MKTIGIYANRHKDLELKYTNEITAFINNLGGNVLILEDVACLMGERCLAVNEKEFFTKSDIIISIGGDGTFLKAARYSCRENKPILGINLGTLGFLTAIEKADYETAISAVLKGKYSLEKRMMLEAEIIRQGKVIASDLAINDIVISKKSLSRILNLKAYINGEFVDSFPGDGLIISTPTGSTAYSLSAGGPVVEPDIELIIVTPICPHTLYSRSFITNGDRVVKVTADNSIGNDAIATFDGQTGFEMNAGDTINIRRSENRVMMVNIKYKNFFTLLRNKIHDRGETLRKDEI